MAITKTTDLDQAVVAKYEKGYKLFALDNPGTWGQFIDWQAPVPEDGSGGSSYDYLFFDDTDPAETALTEDADVTPAVISDSNVTLTPAEWGKTWAVSKKARYMARADLPEVMAKLAGRNRTFSIDRVLRRSVVGHGSAVAVPSQTHYVVSTVSTLLGLGAGHTITHEFVQQLVTKAMTMGIEPMKNGGYVSIVPPELLYDIRQWADFQNIGMYQDPQMYYGAMERPLTVAGVTFIPSLLGRVHLGAGATHGFAASTLAAPAAKGATTVTLTADGGYAVGDYMTIGTVEVSGTTSPSTNLEQVEVTDVSATPVIGFRALGAGTGFGLRFAHAALEPVTHSYNVCTFPILGRDSLIGIHGSDCGRYGKPVVKSGLDTLDRFTYFGWYWFGGVAAVAKRILLGRVSLGQWRMGFN